MNILVQLCPSDSEEVKSMHATNTKGMFTQQKRFGLDGEYLTHELRDGID